MVVNCSGREKAVAVSGLPSPNHEEAATRRGALPFPGPPLAKPLRVSNEEKGALPFPDYRRLQIENSLSLEPGASANRKSL